MRDLGERVDPLIGRIIARKYEVVRRIGQGGMCAVYQLVHRRLARSFAMKTLAPALAADRGALARFRREADIVARLRHPNIVDVVDWHLSADGRPCLVMEYLEGEDLDRRIARSGPLPLADVVRIGDEVLAALDATHRAGVIHRDLKPSNVFLASDGAGGERAKLLDFGISKLAGARSDTATGQLVGTPFYMAPEQIDSGRAPVGPATDLWAMGAILYEMSTGRRAFEAPNVPAALYRICHERPVPVRLVRPDIPPALCALIDEALRDAPTERPTGAAAMRARLRAIAVSPPRARRLVRGAALVSPLACALATTALVAGGWLSVGGQADRRSEAAASAIAPGRLALVRVVPAEPERRAELTPEGPVPEPPARLRARRPRAARRVPRLAVRSVAIAVRPPVPVDGTTDPF